MLSFRSAFLFLAVLTAACGGRVEDTESTNTVDSNRPASAKVKTGCERGCDRLRACDDSSEDRASCIRTCDAHLGDSALKHEAWASCVERLSCADIERAREMSFGPIMACFRDARRL